VNWRWLLSFVRYLAVTAAVAVIVIVYTRLVPVNYLTAALTFLLAILFVAERLGLPYSIYMSFLSTAAFNFYFLPPVGTFTIADTQNWVALFAFLTTAVVASRLSARVKKEVEVANLRRREVERLYDFSQQMLTAQNIVDLLNIVPASIASTFSLDGAVLYITERERTYRSAASFDVIAKEELQLTAERGEVFLDSSRAICIIPLLLGIRSVGALGVAGNFPPRRSLEALSSLIAVAVERASAIQKLTQAQASRENERLRSALLDSVTHELRTPLTAITIAITSLQTETNLAPDQTEDLYSVIEEECQRLNHLIGQAVEMAQLDAQEVQLHLETGSIRDAMNTALEDCRSILGIHPVEIRMPDRVPPVQMDFELIRKVLDHLIENAAKYSPPEGPIFLSAEVKGEELAVNVADRGVGIDDLERSMIFDKFYRGQSQRYRVQGTGMGLAIAKAIIEAHGGTIGVTSQLGHGSVFSFTLHLAPANVAYSEA
jgi:two-component system, OmpR family, sensor histidine kinase KdpD